MSVRIQLLGPLRAWRGGEEIDLGGPKQRAVLALLVDAAATGNPVTPTELIDALWADGPPASAHNVVQTYLKRLRRVLEPDRAPHAPSRYIRRIAGGHTLHLPDLELDLTWFRRLVDSATAADRAGDQRRAAELLADALAHWKGVPLSNTALTGDHPRAVALSAERWTAVAQYGEAMLAIGKPSEALAILAEAAAACPLDEAAHARLVRAHHLAGNRGEAFATYHAIRGRLADELGVDPGPALTAAHLAVLRDDRAGAGDRAPSDAPAYGGTATPPAQLPFGTPVFAGRTEQLRQLDKLAAPRAPEAAAPVVVVVGPAGVGKTTLATHWAHRIAGRFPDGQLFVNLNGFDPAGLAMDPATAVRGFLVALGMPPERMPASAEAQVDLYRGLLAGRRMLIVLDNARDAEQVRPLLPHAPGCFVLVTSRDQLLGLVVTHGAHPLRLDSLSASEARQMLERRLGAERLTTEPAAVAEIVARCAGLPLALAIVAARAATYPQFRLAALALQLGEGLDGLASGDSAADIRAAFSWSYRALTPAAARLFRLLGIHPGPEVGIAVAASLAGAVVREVRPLMVELARAHLVTEPTAGRYAMHDLLRTYAGELAAVPDRHAERHAALHRLLDHYAHMAGSAAGLLELQRDAVAVTDPVPGANPETLTSVDQARAWLTTEHPVLMRVIALAESAGFDRHIVPLAWALGRHLEGQGLWQEQATVQSAALAAAQRLGDRRLVALSERRVGVAVRQSGRRQQARVHLQRALAQFTELSDQVGQAHCHNSLALMSSQDGQHDDAFAHNERALALFRAAGYRPGEAGTLNAIGWGHAQLGDYRLALSYCEEALAMLSRLGEVHGEAIVSDSVGFAHHHLHHYDEARRSYEHALTLFRRLGDRSREAETLTHLGDTLRAIDDRDGAVATWRSALAIYDELADPAAGVVRTMLDGLARS